MKFLITIMTIALFAKECNNKTDHKGNGTGEKQETTSIIYTIYSRGFFEEIILSKDTFSICNDRARQHIKYFKNDAKNWGEYLELLAQIDLNKLPNFKAPTSMRDYDGASHATLTIKGESTEIKSSIFDHEYPPAEIKTLVEKLLSLKKNSSKQ